MRRIIRVIFEGPTNPNLEHWIQEKLSEHFRFQKRDYLHRGSETTTRMHFDLLKKSEVVFDKKGMDDE